jgi:hypothetical protein
MSLLDHLQARPGFGQCSDTFRLSIAGYRPHHRILNRDLSLAVNLELYTNPSGGAGTGSNFIFGYARTVIEFGSQWQIRFSK